MRARNARTITVQDLIEDIWHRMVLKQLNRHSVKNAPIRTRKNSVFGHFSRWSNCFDHCFFPQIALFFRCFWIILFAEYDPFRYERMPNIYMRYLRKFLSVAANFVLKGLISANIYLFQDNNINTKKRCEICWKLAIKTYFSPISSVSFTVWASRC